MQKRKDSVLEELTGKLTELQASWPCAYTVKGLSEGIKNDPAACELQGHGAPPDLLALSLTCLTCLRFTLPCWILLNVLT